jgi:hemoglobin/transferrin/lactoferrin receptor protein
MGKIKITRKIFLRTPIYVATINNVDQLVANEDKYVQKKIQHSSNTISCKIKYKTNLGFEHLNLQFSTSTDIPRYDRLTETDPSTGLRHAQWYYGPQESEYWIFL